MTAMLVVSPMDKHGFFTTGTNTDYAWEVARQGPPMRNVIVEINQNMPRTHGKNFLHISEVTAVVENHMPWWHYLRSPYPGKMKLSVNISPRRCPMELVFNSASVESPTRWSIF